MDEKKVEEVGEGVDVLDWPKDISSTMVSVVLT
jgi:hypothetical protein